MESPVLRHLALLTVAASTVGAAVTGASDVGGPADTVELACGGYNEAGEIVNEKAVEIGTIEVPANATAQVPPVCGGFTADGVFIGDD